MFLAMFAIFAEMESELKSRSVDFGNGECFKRGDYYCPTGNLLGFKRDAKYSMAIEPEGAKSVRLIYDLFLAGYPKNGIAAVMTSLGRPTGMGKLVWKPSSVNGILRNIRYCGDLIMQMTFTENFLTHKAIRNIGQRRLYYEPDHHDGIVTREEQARSLLLLKSDPSSPFFDHKYVIEVIRQGLLAGFIPMNVAFGGYDASYYLCALETADLPQPHIETEVAHIAGVKRIRRELFSDRLAAAVTLSSAGASFNIACAALMPDTAHVEVLLHPTERLLAVRKVTIRNKNAIPWGISSVRARELCRILYQLMGWQKGWTYKTAANCFVKGGERVLLFDLTCCAFKFREDKKLQTAIPSDWVSAFGEDLPKHMMICRRARADKLEDWKVSAPPSPVEGFALGVTPLTREQAEQRIADMRCANG